MHRGAVSRSGEVGFRSSPTLVSATGDLTAHFPSPRGAAGHDDYHHNNHH
jgi:hypothetical protein